MKMSIKEIKEKGEQDDKFKFTGVVKNVFEAKNATPAPGSKSKVVSRQNVMIGDATDEIKVIISHYSKSTEYDKSIIGKEIQVDGKLTFFTLEGKTHKNIFGKLIFKEGDEPIKKELDSPVGIKSGILSTTPSDSDLRSTSLKRAMEFWTARIGDEMIEQKIIATAEVFYKFIAGNPAKISGQSKAKVTEEKKELTTGRSAEQVIKIDNIPLINEIMGLKEEHHLNKDQWEGYTRGKDIKEMATKELEELRDTLKDFTDEIPF